MCFAKLTHGHFTHFWIKISNNQKIITRHVAIQWSPDHTKMRRYIVPAGLYEHPISMFFLRRFNSTKNPSKSLGKEVFSNLAGISSRMYKIIPPPLPFLSNLIGATYPSIVNWLDGNVESNFVSEIINISKLPLIQIAFHFRCISQVI